MVLRFTRTTGRRIRLFWLTGLALACAVVLRAAVPVIYLIEPYVQSQVLLHFSTEAGRTYVVQRCTQFTQSTNGLVGNWVDIVKVDALPFNDHFVAVDTNKTLNVRFYRLKVTP
jgi:hypothetical protein